MGYQLLLWLVVYQSLGHMAADFYQCTCLKKKINIIVLYLFIFKM